MLTAHAHERAEPLEPIVGKRLGKNISEVIIPHNKDNG
jgi:hypothetical protein